MTNKDRVREVVAGVLRSVRYILPSNRVEDGIADALCYAGLIAPDPPKAYRIDMLGGRYPCIVRACDGQSISGVQLATPAERTAMLDALNAMEGEGDR